MREPNLPTLLFYCQHSLGIGHLTRSFALAQALSRHFRVVFLNGGRLPPGVPVPAAIERIDLPPLGMDDGHTVVSRDGQLDVARAQAERRRRGTEKDDQSEQAPAIADEVGVAIHVARPSRTSGGATIFKSAKYAMVSGQTAPNTIAKTTS